MTIPALELKNITRSWRTGSPVFSELSLIVPDRRITVLLGPSGCGKSTLLRCAASLDSPDRGQILVNGKISSMPSPERQLILQADNQLLPWLSVGDNVSFPVRAAGGSTTGFRPKDILDAVGLPDSAGLYPAQLSGGMRQRAVLARALAAKPSILLLDEPFAALDTAIRSRLQSLLISINRKRQTTMLLVTHDVNEALILADIIVFMDSAGNLSSPEDNPMKENRNPDSPDFQNMMMKMRRRYGVLLDPVYP